MNSITGNEAAAMVLRSAEARLPSQPEEFEELMNWRRIVYVRVGQLDLEISEAVQWGKALHEAMWRRSTARQMEEKELEGQREKKKELEGQREKRKSNRKGRGKRERTEGEAMRQASSSNTRRSCRRRNLRRLCWRSRRRSLRQLRWSSSRSNGIGSSSHRRLHHWSRHPRWT